MIEGREDLDLGGAEARGGIGEEDSDGDAFVEIAIDAFAMVDDAHAAAADFFGSFVGTEDLAAEVDDRFEEEAALALPGIEWLANLIEDGWFFRGQGENEVVLLVDREFDGSSENLFDSGEIGIELHWFYQHTTVGRRN